MGIIIKCEHDAEKIKKAREILRSFGIINYEEHNYKEYIGIEILVENGKLSRFFSSKYFNDDGFIKTDWNKKLNIIKMEMPENFLAKFPSFLFCLVC